MKFAAVVTVGTFLVNMAALFMFMDISTKFLGVCCIGTGVVWLLFVGSRLAIPLGKFLSKRSNPQYFTKLFKTVSWYDVEVQRDTYESLHQVIRLYVRLNQQRFHKQFRQQPHLTDEMLFFLQGLEGFLLRFVEQEEIPKTTPDPFHILHLDPQQVSLQRLSDEISVTLMRAFMAWKQNKSALETPTQDS